MMWRARLTGLLSRFTIGRLRGCHSSGIWVSKLGLPTLRSLNYRPASGSKHQQSTAYNNSGVVSFCLVPQTMLGSICCAIMMSGGLDLANVHWSGMATHGPFCCLCQAPTAPSRTRLSNHISFALLINISLEDDKHTGWSLER